MKQRMGFLALFFSLILSIDFPSTLLARGEHRIEVQNYGREGKPGVIPEASIDILQSQYYNDNHGDFVIRIEDLNKTLNREIDQDVQREYTRWFENSFLQNFSQYQQAAEMNAIQQEEMEETTPPEPSPENSSP